MGESDMGSDKGDREESIIKAARESRNVLDEAVRQHMKDVDVTGLITGWVLIAAVTDFTDEGTETDGMFATNSDGLTKWSRVGLLSVALAQETNEEYW